MTSSSKEKQDKGRRGNPAAFLSQKNMSGADAVHFAKRML